MGSDTEAALVAQELDEDHRGERPDCQRHSERTPPWAPVAHLQPRVTPTAWPAPAADQPWAPTCLSISTFRRCP